MDISLLKSKTEEMFFSSKKRLLGTLAVMTLLFSIPVTMSLISQRQDIRQRAAGGATPSGGACVFNETCAGVDTWCSGSFCSPNCNYTKVCCPKDQYWCPTSPNQSPAPIGQCQLASEPCDCDLCKAVNNTATTVPPEPSIINDPTGVIPPPTTPTPTTATLTATTAPVGTTATPISYPTKCSETNDDTKMRGDADCDGKVGMKDLAIWKREYLGLDATKRANFDYYFNSNTVVELRDLMIWRDTCIKNRAECNAN